MPVTFAAVASAAGISRSWLYTQADIRDQIQRLRGTRNGEPAGAIPAAQRATDTSLRARLTTALQRNQSLADENARLHRQLARALGDQRSARTRSGNDPAPETLLITQPPSRQRHYPLHDGAGHKPD